MQPKDYIQPINFKQMLSSAEKIQQLLNGEEVDIRQCSSVECSIEALYNMIQETKENEDLQLLLIDCRDGKAYEENHIVQSISIPANATNSSHLGSAVCDVGLDPSVQYLCCLYGESQVQIDVLLHQLGKVHFSCPIMHTIAPFSQIYQDFPFITSSYTPVIHGILPLSLADSSLFISSGSIDTSLFPIKSTINLCDSSSIFLPVASTCLQEGLSSIQHSLSLSPPILLSCDNPYDRLPQLLVLLLFRNQHPSFSIEVCFDHLHTSWKSFSISLSSLSSWIDTSSLDFHTYRVTSNLSRILNKLSSFCDMHHTPLDTSCILSYSFITQVSSTWECNQFFPLFDYIASSIRTVSVDALNTITGHHSVFDALFNIPILDLQTSNREILLQLLCECVGECMQSVLALPLLLRHQSSIQTLLQASLTSSRHATRRYALQTIAVITRFCGQWHRLQYKCCSQLLQSSFVAENPVSSLMEEGVATWNRFVVESIGKQYKQETEMRIEWIELYGMIAFFLDNDCEVSDLSFIYPHLVIQYTLCATSDNCRHECGGCFGWLRERLLVLLMHFSFVSCTTLIHTSLIQIVHNATASSGRSRTRTTKMPISRYCGSEST
ncbi:hypothetical protein WA171_000409 [Blastocystis sp. BT1]